MEYFLPANHFLTVLLKNLQDLLIEVSLQRVVVLNPFLFHEGLNLWIAVPLLAFILVAANVHVGVRKQRRHLTQKAVKEFVCLLAAGIECRLKNAYAALDLIWTRRA